MVHVRTKQFIYCCLILVLALISNSCGNDRGKEKSSSNRLSETIKGTEKESSNKPSETVSAEEMVSLFKKRVALFEEFLSREPRLLIKEDYSRSPSGLLYVFRIMQPHEITYDVQKTSSLVSPHIGYIDVSYTVMESMRCGDVEIAHLKFYSTYEKARADAVDSRCFVTNRKDLLFGARFVFSFQDGRWMFQKVLGIPGNPNESENLSSITFSEAFAANNECLPVNSHWIKLIN